MCQLRGPSKIDGCHNRARFVSAGSPAGSPDWSASRWPSSGLGLIARDGSPVSDVAQVVIELLPAAWVAEVAGAVGLSLRIVLMAGIVAVALVLAVIAGQLELKRKQLSLAVYLPVGVVTLLAVSTQVGPGALGYVPAVLGLATGYLTLRLLIAEIRRPPGALEPVAAERRNFLKTAGLVTLGGIVVAGAGRMLVQASNKVAEVRTKILLPAPATPAPTVPPGADLDVAGLTQYITPTDSFYRIDTALQLPTIDPETWTLEDHRSGRQRADRHVRRAPRPAADRAPHDVDLHVQPGRR